jgi:hypothetical protein
MKTLEEIYNEKCADIHSDIFEHLPTLKRYAKECEHITEMGVRWVVSTYALMMGKPKKLISIDIKEQYYGNTYSGNQNKWHTAILVKDTNYNFVIDLTCSQLEQNLISTNSR